MSSSLWICLRKFAMDMTPLAITTSKLGRVTYVRENGEAVSTIPYELQYIAAKYGLVIVAADYTNNQYTLKVAPCPKCGGEMKPGQALDQTWTGSPEWEGDTICTM